MSVTVTIEIMSIKRKLPDSNWIVGRCQWVPDPDIDGKRRFRGIRDISGNFPLVSLGIPYRVKVEETQFRGIDQLRLIKGSIPERIGSLITKAGVTRYLRWIKKNFDGARKAAGEKPISIGESRLRSLVDAFGTEALEAARDNPEGVASIHNWNHNQARVLQSSIIEYQKDEKVLHELMSLGVNGALSTANVFSLFEKFERAAPTKVKENPYGLIEHLNNYGWRKADTLSIANLRWNHSVPVRVSAATTEVLRWYAWGHTDQEWDVSVDGGNSWAPYKKVVKLAAALTSRGHPEERANHQRFQINTIESNDSLEIIPGNTGPRVYLKKIRAAELVISDFVRLSETKPKRPIYGSPKRFMEGLNDLQQDGFIGAITNPLFIIRGGPGRGKTHLCRSVILTLEKQYAVVHLLAPTGRAAARLSELTGKPAETIHRYLLRTQGAGIQEATHFIVDESSMIDVKLMSDFIATLRRGQSCCFVGDSEQLPPVGPGKPFIEMIASGKVPEIELTEIMRTDRDGIITAASIANSGVAEGFDSPTDGLAAINDPSFSWIQMNAMDAQRAAVSHVEKLLAAGIHPSDIQIVSATNGYRQKKSDERGQIEPARKPLASRSINGRVARIFNPDGKLTDAVGFGDKLSIGDRVMNLKNQTVAMPEGDIQVMNGEIGFVEFVRKVNNRERVFVRFGEGTNDERLISWPSNDNNLVMAYAATCHKFQGSEAPHIIVVFDLSAGRILDRSWLYTAITRASQSCTVIAPLKAMKKAIRSKAKVFKRNSGLLELMLSEEPRVIINLAG